MVELEDSQINSDLTATHEALGILILEYERLVDARQGPEWASNNLAQSDAGTASNPRQLFERILDRKVGIAGQEGVGKSTLINAILGQDAVPTDENQPGTAAPIEVCITRSEQTTYEVETDSGPIQCASRLELADYVLHRYDTDHGSRVRKGLISLPSRHLPPGFCLVDLPGADGMSFEFRQDAVAALDSADSVILVVQDRAVGPAARLAQEVLDRGIAIDAVAINIQMSKLIDASTLQPLPDDQVRDHISETTKFVAKSFIKECISLHEQCKFFAFHFPSMHALSVAPKSKHWIPEHANEIFRFGEWVTDAYGLSGIALRMRQLLELVESTAAQHKGRIAGERKQIDGLLNSDQDVVEQLNQSIARRRTENRQAWTREMATGRIQQATERAWEEFQPSVLELKSKLQKIHRTTTAAMPESWWSQNWQLRDKISIDLNRAIAGARSRLDSKANSCVQRYADTCRQVAQCLAVEEQKLAPIDLGPVFLSSTETPSVWPAPDLDTGPRTLSEYDSARVIERLLDELAVAEMTINAAQGSPIFEAFHKVLVSHSLSIGAEMESRLDRFRSMAQDPHSPTLVAAKERLSDHFSILATVSTAADSVQSELRALEVMQEERRRQTTDMPKRAQESSLESHRNSASSVHNAPDQPNRPFASIGAAKKKSVWRQLLNTLASGLGRCGMK